MWRESSSIAVFVTNAAAGEGLGLNEGLELNMLVQVE
jgi:hypothetical protein